MQENIVNKTIEKYDFLQKFIGYAITGLTKEKLLGILISEGSNSKSTFIQILNSCFDTIMTHVDKCVIMKSSTSLKRAATLELHSLKSCRMAIIIENEKNEYINNSTVKRITKGKDVICSRDLFQGI